MKYGSELLGHPIFPESIPLAHLLLRAPGFNLTVIYASQRLSITLIHITCRWFRLILSILSTRLFFQFCDKPIFARQRFIIISNCVCSPRRGILNSRWYCYNRENVWFTFCLVLLAFKRTNVRRGHKYMQTFDIRICMCRKIHCRVCYLSRVAHMTPFDSNVIIPLSKLKIQLQEFWTFLFALF